MTRGKKEQVIPEHRDILGILLAVGDYVAYPETNALRVGTIEKLNPKMLRIKGSRWAVQKYPAAPGSGKHSFPFPLFSALRPEKHSDHTFSLPDQQEPYPF